MTYTPEVIALAETLQRFQDVNEFRIPPSPLPPTASNMLRAKYLIEHGYVHQSWKEPAA